MNLFILKETVIDLRTGELLVYYSGKDDHVFINETSPVPYKSYKACLNKIKRDTNYSWYKKVDDFNYIENNNFSVKYEIIEL